MSDTLLPNMAGDREHKVQWLEARIKELETKQMEVFGWFYAEACQLVEQGIDIRKEELPKIVERAKKDLEL